jgi:hypothetical protein
LTTPREASPDHRLLPQGRMGKERSVQPQRLA